MMLVEPPQLLAGSGIAGEGGRMAAVIRGRSAVRIMKSRSCGGSVSKISPAK